MKVISTFKDYYDYAAGHDTDPRKIYNRKTEKYNLSDVPEHDIFKHLKETAGWSTRISDEEWRKLSKEHVFKGGIWFCDQYFRYIYHIPAEKYYFNFEDIPEDIKDRYYYKASWYARRHKKGQKLLNNHLEEFFINDTWSRRTYWRSTKPDYWERKMNTEYGQPVIFSMLDEEDKPLFVVNGRLSDVSFGSIKSPQEAFTELYNWIPFYEPPIPSDPVDMQRFEGKGFDKKTSFRKM